MHVRHRDGRIIKPEGSPDHPVSRGGLCPRGQSAPQGIYDPDRVVTPRVRSQGQWQSVEWNAALQRLGQELHSPGAHVAIISDLQTGSLLETMHAFAAAFDSPRLLMYEAFNFEAVRRAHKLLLGISAIPRYTFSRAELILSFGADFLETWISPVEYATHFAQCRSVGDSPLSRFYSFGPRLSMTAANADEHFTTAPGQERWCALALLQAMIEEDLVIREDASRVRSIAASLGAPKAFERSGLPRQVIARIAREFATARSSIAFAAPTAARDNKAAIDAALAAALLNYASGRVGREVDFSRTHALGATGTEAETKAFLDGISPNDILIIHQTNIGFTRPDAIESLRRARLVVYLSTLPDETAQIADWVLPIDSPLEAWGDYEPYTGIRSSLQPGMGRMYDTRSAGDVFMKLAVAGGKKPLFTQQDGEPVSFASLVRRRWNDFLNKSNGPRDIDHQSLLQRGFFIEPVSAAPVKLSGREIAPFHESSPESQTGKLSLCAWPSINLYDGRLSNRGWMQEVPERVSYIAWSAWADLHPDTARDAGIKEKNLIRISTEQGSIDLPARITDEIAPNAIAVTIGQGHTSRELTVAYGIGDNPFRLLQAKTSDLFGLVAVRRIGAGDIVYTSATRSQEHRGILRHVKESDLSGTSEPEEIDLPLPQGYTRNRDLYPPHPHAKHRWAMIVDLQRCIGCGACEVACYAENNIPVMGPRQLAGGREMAWLRVVPIGVKLRHSCQCFQLIDKD
jgi:molybdopterin-containing oxidoreductase family iron-sulfur binding subunit